MDLPDEVQIPNLPKNFKVSDIDVKLFGEFNSQEKTFFWEEEKGSLFLFNFFKTIKMKINLENKYDAITSDLEV